MIRPGLEAMQGKAPNSISILRFLR